MRTPRPLLPLLVILGIFLALGQLRGQDGAAVRELRLDPATTPVLVGKAKLTVEPLVRGGGGLRAGYKVEVIHLPFGDEAGTLSVAISDDALRELADGKSIQFTGQAVSSAGDHSAVQGSATPSASAKDTGAVRVRIESKKGRLVFRTIYHLMR